MEIPVGTLLHRLVTEPAAQRFSVLINTTSDDATSYAELQLNVLRQLFNITLSHYNQSGVDTNSLLSITHVNEISN